MDQNQTQDQGQTQSTPKQQVAERIRTANNVLVTVTSNPSVDELAATIGLTLMLNKLGKHATAVFSGQVPSTLEFLKPEQTLETNTDSLRDFIVSLDKSKADKLRYKVEEDVVKIFITPYRTSITQDDLEFTQGDFNVDVVLALGVTQREELDQAITQHGRILHDATVVTVTAGQDYSELGQINWQEQGASSLSEMLVSISEALQGGLMDEQIATAFLTGIVAETERFSNTRTSPKVMTMAAQLMAAGANQQLIANELEKVVEVDLPPAGPEPVPQTSGAVPADIPPVNEPGTLSIVHDDLVAKDSTASVELSESQPEASSEIETHPVEQEQLVPPSETETGRLLPPIEQPATSESFEPAMDTPAVLPEAPVLGMVSTPELQPEATKEEPQDTSTSLPPMPEPMAEPDGEEDAQIHIDTEGNLVRKAAIAPKHKVIQPLPPSEPEGLPSATEAVDPLAASGSDELVGKFPLPPASVEDNTTLEQIEEAVQSPHLTQEEAVLPDADSARSAIEAAHGQEPFDPSHNARADVGGLPLGAPPEQSSYDSFRLPDAPAVSGAAVTDVSGNLPVDAEPSPKPEKLVAQVPGGMPLHSLGEVIPEENQMAPPPVPPPMMPR